MIILNSLNPALKPSGARLNAITSIMHWLLAICGIVALRGVVSEKIMRDELVRHFSIVSE